MRIALLFPRLKTMSGAERLVLGLCRQLAEWGHETHLLTRAVDERCAAAVPPEVAVHTLSRAPRLTGNHLLDSALDVALSPLLLRYLPAGVDVLCGVSDPILPAMWASRRLLHRELPTVYYCLQPPRFVYDLQRSTIQGYGTLAALSSLLAGPYRAMDRRAARACDRILVLSRDYHAWCERLYGPHRIELAPPGVEPLVAPPGAAARLRSRLGIAPDAEVVTTVNKLIPRKNVDLFLRAMSDVARRRPGVHGVVVGHGPFERRLRRLADRLELGGVVSFTGFLPGPDELAACYAAADVYVFLERNVPFGLTVVEASAAGVPVVAFRGGGTSDTVVDGMTGRLLDPDAGEGEVADQICWLLEHREERLAMGRRAAREAQRFEHPAAVRAFLRALQDTVGGAAA